MEDSSTGARGVRRPHRNLLLYYFLQSLLLGPFFPALLIPRFLRFRTLRYRFDDEGISMSWGALFRREISLTYARLQDIHLTSNFVERRLGLARLALQTAAGSAAAEMTLEGLRDFDELRDFLYSRMRGSRGAPAKVPAEVAHGTPIAQAVAALREATAELRALREELAARHRENAGES
jgi:putative membrane protein